MKIFIDDVIRIATEEIGYLEKATNAYLDAKTANPGPGNWTKYARDLWNADPHFFQGPKNGYDWCTIFFAWCIYEASGHDSTHAQEILYYTGPYGAGCTYAVEYYKAAHAWYTSDPKPGDQIFFGSGESIRHTGLVVSVDSRHVYTIEGNSNNSVSQKMYKLTDSCIIGYGRPKYDGTGCAFPFVDVPKSAWYYDAARWCYDHGIVAGTDSTHLSPNRTISRAEIMQMLYRALK